MKGGRISAVTGLLLGACLSCGAQEPPPFDAARAYAQLKKQCEFGPRVPGSLPHQRCRDWLLATLRSAAGEVTTQDFIHTFGSPRQSARASNIIANFQPQKGERILLCAHWDSRPWADQDPDPKNHTKPILGANDGGSGVAVLLEIARLLQQKPPRCGVDIVLFDAEDQGTEGDERSYAKGAQHFARSLVSSYHPRFGILLDMVGDANLNIYQEHYSLQYARPVVDKVWEAAARSGVTEFIPQPGYAVYDDHLPLLERGIPCIDLIDFDYPPWHTLADTPDKCSPASLEKVGRVLLQVIYSQ
ncbi:MAG TPA: M28 family peptidase [bacterium]|nr:M28 family peptidase [bacterium]